MAEEPYSEKYKAEGLRKLLEKIEIAQKEMPGKMGNIRYYLGDVRSIYGDKLPRNYGGTFLVVEPKKVHFDPALEGYLDVLRMLEEKQLKSAAEFIGSQINRMSAEIVEIPLGRGNSGSTFYNLILFTFPPECNS